MTFLSPAHIWLIEEDKKKKKVDCVFMSIPELQNVFFFFDFAFNLLLDIAFL